MADPNAERDPLEVLAAEYMERLRRGQHPSVEEYAARHPELSGEIRELFPTIAVTERLKARGEQSSGGRVSLGAAPLERLGDFRLIREIGRGGMGVVFEAEQESLGRRVAVKVLPRQALLDEKHLKRFQREARIAANLHHTHIVEVFGIGQQDGFHYYVMQYIQGIGLDTVVPALAKAVRNRGAFLPEVGDDRSPAADPSGIHASTCSEVSQTRNAGPPTPQSVAPPATGLGLEDASVAATVRQLLGQVGVETGHLDADYWRNVAWIGLQAADALSHAHGQDVLHRDIKPANLLLDDRCNVWLADFGLAKAAQSDDLSLSRDIVGTLRYMAPEQFRGQTDRRSDIYSLGLTLYELLALRPAYEEADQSRLIQRITQEMPSPPRALNPGIPSDLETIILKAISHEAGGRYPSAGEMADDLRRFLEDRPISARRASSVERLGRWCRRNKALASLAGTSLMLLVLVAVVASAGYLRTRKALQGEALERSKAEANANLAIDALDRTFERLYPTRVLVRPQPTIEGLQGEIMDLPSAPILSKETAGLLDEMLPFYERLSQQTGNRDDVRLRTAEANRRVGAIRQRLGQSDEAVEAYQRAITLLSELSARSPTNATLPLKLAQTHNELGRLLMAQRQAAEARRSHLAALALLETEAAGSSAPPAVRFELARTRFFLGLRERPLPATAPPERRGPEEIPGEGRDSLAKAVLLLDDLSASSAANPEYQHLLALCYLEGAPVDDGRGPDLQAGDERAIEILEGLVQAFPDIPDYAYDLSEACARIHLPDPPVPPKVQATIEQRLDRSLALLEDLASKHPDVPDFLASEAQIHHKTGSFQRQMRHWTAAEQSFREAIAIQTTLLNQFPEAPYYGLWMATFRLALADALIRLNQPETACAELEVAIVELLLLQEQRPPMNSLQDVLALAYSQLEMALRRVGEEALADEAARQAAQERDAGHRFP